MTKVFAYLRVSSKGQVEGDGFIRQRAAVERFCQARGWEVATHGWFQEDISGTVESAERPIFAEMLTKVGPETATIIIVENADRLARDLVVSELLINEAEKQGVTIWAANSEQELTNQTDPTRILIRQLLGALAQWEKSNIVRRLRVSRERMRKEKGRCEGRVSPWAAHRSRDFGYIVRYMKEHECKRTIGEMKRWLELTRIPALRPSKGWTRHGIFQVMQRAKEFIRLGDKHPDANTLPVIKPKTVDLGVIEL